MNRLVLLLAVAAGSSPLAAAQLPPTVSPPPTAASTPGASAGPQEPGPARAPVISGVELHLPPDVDPAGLPELVGVRKGQQLSRRMIRRSIERLYATQRFADVVVLTEHGANGVNVVFEIVPKKYIATISVGGNRVLSDDEVKQAAKIGPGAKSEYYPERIAAAIRDITDAYRARGYEQARVAVDLSETPTGTELVFFTEEGEPTRIEAITVAGSPGLPMSRILAAAELQPGSVLSRAALDTGLEKLRALYRSERFYRARVGEPEIDSENGKATLRWPISSGPQFGDGRDGNRARAFHFHGNRSLPDRVLEGVLDYDPTEPLDGAMIARLARRIEALYRFRGYPDAHVATREVPSPDRSRMVVVFDVEEGPPLFVRELSFDGNVALTTNELELLVEDVFRSMEVTPKGEVALHDDPLDSEGRGTSDFREAKPEPRSVWVEPVYRRAVEVIAALYRDRGHLQAKAELADVEIDERDRTARIRIAIDEGPRAIVREVSYRGTPAGFDVRGVLPLTSGQPLRSAQVDSARTALIRALGRAGYLFAQVNAGTALSRDGRTASVTFDIDSGPRVTIGQVIVPTLNRTDEALVRANLRVQAGDVLDPEKLFESQRALLELGIFRQVAVRLNRPEEIEAVKDVTIEVVERPRIEGEYAVGASVVDGPRIGGDITYPNLLGQGVNVSLRGKLNYVGLSLPVLFPPAGRADSFENSRGWGGFGGRLNLSLSQPRLYAALPALVGFRGDLIGERVHRPSYQFTRFAGITGVNWEATDWLSFALQGELEHDRVNLTEDQSTGLLSRADEERLRFPAGQFTLVTARPAVTLDFRDDPVNPNRGVLLTGSTELTRDLYANDVVDGEIDIFHLKVSGALSLYVPIAPRVTLALSARGGRIIHLLESSRTIAPKRFFLGGTLSMRGFREDGVLPEDRRQAFHEELDSCRRLINKSACTQSATSLRAGRELFSQGGELFTLGKAELRFPGFGSFDFGVFGEAGNLWLDGANYDPTKLRYVVGAGIRYVTPIGPLALDAGVNLFPDEALNERYFNNVNFSIGLF